MSWFEFANIAKNALTNAQKSIDKALDIQTVDGGGGEEWSEPQALGSRAKSSPRSNRAARPESPRNTSRTTPPVTKVGGTEPQGGSREPPPRQSEVQKSPRDGKSNFWEEFLVADQPDETNSSSTTRKAKAKPVAAPLGRRTSPDESALLATATGSMDRGRAFVKSSSPAKSLTVPDSPSRQNKPDPVPNSSQTGVGRTPPIGGANVQGTVAAKARSPPAPDLKEPGAAPDDQSAPRSNDSPKSGSDRYDSSESESIEVISLASTGVGGNDLVRDLSPLVVRVPRLSHRKTGSDTSGSQPSPDDDDDQKSGSTVEVIPESIPPTPEGYRDPAEGMVPLLSVVAVDDMSPPPREDDAVAYPEPCDRPETALPDLHRSQKDEMPSTCQTVEDAPAIHSDSEQDPADSWRGVPAPLFGATPESTPPAEANVSASWVDVETTAFDDAVNAEEELNSVDSVATVTNPVPDGDDENSGDVSDARDPAGSGDPSLGGDDVPRQTEVPGEEGGFSDSVARDDSEEVEAEADEDESREATRPEKLLKKLAEMAEILQAREAQVLTLSSENVQLHESNSILSNQIGQLEAVRAAETEDLNAITDEFTERLTEMDRRAQQAVREKDSFKKQTEALQEQLAARTTADELALIVAEKDEMIAELQQEGEKLSKQQLQYANTIKKLRAKDKESDASRKTSQKTLDDKFGEIEKLRLALEKHEELEREHRESIRRLNAAVECQEEELVRLRSDHDDAAGKEAAFQTALDTAYREIADLHKQNAASLSRAEESSLSAETMARDEMKQALDVFRNDAKLERESLLDKISDLQVTITRHEQQQTRREDALRNETLDLRQRLQEAEGRNQELTDSVSASTRPLLRQIENLQQTFTAQGASWEGVERNLTQRLSDSQSHLAAAVEKERMATEQLIATKSKFSAMESQLALLREECSKLRADGDVDRSVIGTLREQVVKLDQHALISTRLSDEQASRFGKEKTNLENQLELEKFKSETDRKKLHQFVMDQNKERDKRLQMNRQDSNTDLASVKSNSSGRESSQRIESIEQSLLHSPTGGSLMNVYDTLRNSSLSTVIENLQSQLKQRDGEIGLQKRDIVQLEKTRASLAEEIVRLTNENEDFALRLEQIQPMEEEIQELNSKYNVMLQMYGEKEETCEELKMDLIDVKEMYKTQINDLLQKM